jgi:hypothetical protein
MLLAITISVILLNVIMLNIIILRLNPYSHNNAFCHYPECHSADCDYAPYHDTYVILTSGIPKSVIILNVVAPFLELCRWDECCFCLPVIASFPSASASSSFDVGLVVGGQKRVFNWTKTQKKERKKRKGEKENRLKMRSMAPRHLA